jgi:predicted transcriptional regulator
MRDTKEMVHFSLDLSPELNQILEELARKIGGTKSDVLRQAITLMQVLVQAKEQTQKLGITAVDELIATEIITSFEDASISHPLETFMERLGAWEDERTPEEIIKDIYNNRTSSNFNYSL